MDIVQTVASSLTTFSRTLTTSKGFSEFLSKGETGIGANENRGNATTYLDIRTDPPVWFFRFSRPSIPGDVLAKHDWDLRTAGLLGTTTLSDVQFWDFLPRYSFLTINMRLLVSAFISRLTPLGSTGLNDREGVISADELFEINTIFPDDNLNNLTGLPGLIKPIGVG